ncbi:hypothetical protein DBR43_03485 [Pedobacter sp. KBW06]|uniref:AhpC/TSA family protein n=1 Tax=Pedobacter sp. KBW06 TaxID=2153359 RepID=UPI000F596CEE|nr:AhpC/TSA family protein [Pedobacter sp. KBW06]RQO74468.1 hypothetical protein DBR43_03485 [Pedobacter sp. KBW06]
MKNILKPAICAIVLCLMLLNPALAQNVSKFVINGVLKNMIHMPDKVFLIYPDYEGKKIDSTNVVNGIYRFKGEIENDALPLILALGPEMDPMSPSNDLQADLVIVKGVTTVTSEGTIYNVSETGASAKLYNQYGLLYNKYFKLGMEFIAKIKTVAYRSRKAVRAFEYSEYSKSIKAYFPDFYQFILQNSDSSLAPFIAYKIGDNKLMSKEKADSLIAILSISASRSKVRTAALAKLKDKSGFATKEMSVAVDSLAPDFSQNDVNGKAVKLSSFRGKYVLLDFWASWCGPCRAENPSVVKAYAKYHNQNFEILGVSLDMPGKKADWLAAIKQDGLNWPQVSDLKYGNNAAAKLYAVTAIPQNFLIDPNGKIIAKNLRGDELEKKLSEIFK